jgi:hypothetical protein
MLRAANWIPAHLVALRIPRVRQSAPRFVPSKKSVPYEKMQKHPKMKMKETPKVAPANESE